MSELALKNERHIAYWLLICCVLVFAMVILGGVTRLTGSGLSMVEWKPVYGVLPPLSDSDWQALFAKYQQSPEYQHVNIGMDISGFKGIFWLEYLHRILGRIIGVVFFLPSVVVLVNRENCGGVITQTPHDVCTRWIAGVNGLVYGQKRSGR